jgi:hypothetical protein
VLKTIARRATGKELDLAPGEVAVSDVLAAPCGIDRFDVKADIGVNGDGTADEPTCVGEVKPQRRLLRNGSARMRLAMFVHVKSPGFRRHAAVGRQHATRQRVGDSEVSLISREYEPLGSISFLLGQE